MEFEMQDKPVARRESFCAPAEVIKFIEGCITMNDPERLYQACSLETSDFWKGYLFQDLREIHAFETLQAVFLRDGRVSEFTPMVDVFKLGGHDMHTKFLHIDLERVNERWYLKSIWKCR